jgi:hypothetical protein
MELDLVSPEKLLLGIAHWFATPAEVYRTTGENRFSRVSKGEAGRGGRGEARRGKHGFEEGMKGLLLEAVGTQEDMREGRGGGGG